MLTLLAALYLTCGVPATLIPPPKPLATQIRDAERAARIERLMAEAEKTMARTRKLMAEFKQQRQAHAEASRPLGDIVQEAEQAERERLGRAKD